MNDLLRRLTEAYGPSGSESNVSTLIAAEIAQRVDEWYVDPLGNLVALKKPIQTGGKSIMVAAHMDEIGVVATHIDDEGFLRFAQIGRVKPHVLLGQRVRFANGTVGVVGAEALEDMKDLAHGKMFIDIGADSRSAAEKMVRVGDSACMHREYTESGSRIIAKALDDRVGCFVAIEVLRRLKETPHEIHFVFSVQEEVGTRGAQPAAFAVEPDLGLALDVTPTGDSPKARPLNVRLGHGAAIKVKDRMLVTHPGVKKALTQTAEDHDIPYQLEVLPYGGTDAGPIHLSRSGVPSGVVSIPVRYVHTPGEMVDTGDVNATIDLVTAFLQNPIAL